MISAIIKEFQQTDEEFAGFMENWLNINKAKIPALRDQIAELKKSSNYSDQMLAWSLDLCIERNQPVLKGKYNV